MKIFCKCGSAISDNTDFMRDKGRVVGDQDWGQFVEDLEPILNNAIQNGDMDSARMKILKALALTMNVQPHEIRWR